MIVRRATPDDCEGVVTCARAYELTTCDDDYVASLFHVALACDGMFVALDQAIVVGFCGALVLPHPFSGQPYLNVIAVFVHPTHRGTWAALGLLRAMLAWALLLPLNTVTISAPQGSGLSRILERLHFTPLETVFIKRL